MDDTAPTVVVVGASAGGVEALTTLVAGLPQDLDAAVCVVLHLYAGAESRLADILSRAGPLPATQAHGGERLLRGRVYVAPPDRHLIVRGRRALVRRSPRENGARPSIDVLFHSAARAYARRTVAVVLSGTRDDGVSGASAVEARGGCVLVQDPEDALFATLPMYALTRDRPDRVLPLTDLPSAITAAIEHLSGEGGVSENSGAPMSPDNGYATVADEVLEHASGSGLGESVEVALRTAFRALQERARVSERLAERVGAAGANRSRQRFEAVAEEAREQAETIRRLLARSDGPQD